MKPLRVIISGGGTGGHIFPAIAIARAIMALRPDSKILFVGAEGKMEMEKVPAAGFEIVGLPIAGIQRRITWRNLVVPFKVVASLWKAKSIIKTFRPDVAIGVGGYASGPLLRTACAMGIKTLIQEQNSFPGITNRILSKKVDQICVAYDGLENFFPASKIIITGNPVRRELASLEGKKERGRELFHLDENKKTILVVGGSLGARSINHAMKACSRMLTEKGYQVIWQTGKSFYQQAWTYADNLPGESVHVYDFIREMDLAYACADVVVSRAGAMSISELCIVKKPAILIPSPNVSEDHQTKNARALVDRGAAILLADHDAQSRLGPMLIELLADEEKLFRLSAGISALGKPDATERIVACVLSLVSEPKPAKTNI